MADITRWARYALGLCAVLLAGCTSSGAPAGDTAVASDPCAAANRRIEMARTEPERQLAVLDAAEACRGMRSPAAAPPATP